MVDAGSLAWFRYGMPRSKEPSRNRSVRLPESLWKRVEEHAELLTARNPTLRYSTNDVVRIAMEAYLEHANDIVPEAPASPTSSPTKPSTKSSTKATAKTSKRST